MALNTNTYGYVIDPFFSFCDQGGKTIANGYVRIFLAGTSTPVLTYRNFDGALNAETIELDNSGRALTNVIASKGNLYKVCVYDAEHSQEDPILTVDKVAVIGASVNATNIVQGMNDVAGSGWIKSVSADDTAEISLDATNVTSEVDTMVKATAASADYMMPLVHKTGSDPDKKITLGNIFKFVLNFIHSLTDTATESDIASGNYFALDGSAGTKKLNSTTLLTKTAQNALAGNVAPAFDPTRTSVNPYKAGESVTYEGKVYTFNVDHYGAWVAGDVEDGIKVFESIKDRAFKNYVGASTPSISIPVYIEQGGYSYGNPTTASNRVRSSDYINLVKGASYTLTIDASYSVSCQFFDENGVYLDYINFGSSISFTAEYAKMLIIFKAVDDSDINTTDVVSASFSINGKITAKDDRVGKTSLYKTLGSVITNIAFEQGTYSANSVTPSSSDYRIRSGLVDLKIGAKYRVRVTSGYKVSIRFCDSFGNYHDYLEFNQEHEFVSKYAKAAFIISVSNKNPPEKEIRPSDLVDIGFTFASIDNVIKSCENDFLNKLAEQELFGVSIPVIFEQGSYSSGTPTWRLDRCRSIGYIDLNVGSSYKVIVSDDYEVTGQFFDIDNVYKDYLGSFAKSFEFTAEYPKMLFNIKRSDNGNFSPIEFNYSSFLFYKKTPIQLGVDIPSRFVGLKANVIGDSITAGLGVGASKAWVETFKQKLGLSVCRNYGISGSTIASGSDAMSTRYASMDNDADLILVFGSRNDYATNVPIGLPTDNTNTTFYGAVNILVEGLWAKYPTSTIVFVSMFRAMKKLIDDTIVYDSTPNGAGASQDDYNDVLREVCKKHAIPVVDLYYSGTFNSWNAGMKTAFFQDTVHPNVAGHVFLGALMASKISCL